MFITSWCWLQAGRLTGRFLPRDTARSGLYQAVRCGSSSQALLLAGDDDAGGGSALPVLGLPRPHHQLHGPPPQYGTAISPLSLPLYFALQRPSPFSASSSSQTRSARRPPAPARSAFASQVMFYLVGSGAG